MRGVGDIVQKDAVAHPRRSIHRLGEGRDEAGQVVSLRSQNEIRHVFNSFVPDQRGLGVAAGVAWKWSVERFVAPACESNRTEVENQGQVATERTG